MTTGAEREFMLQALKEAKEGCSSGNGGPFGAVIVKRGEVVARGHNMVLSEKDPTRHAEIVAISRAAGKLGTYDLTGCDVYSTTEPCPMCFSAIHWARLDRLIYGTSIDDVRELGFNEMTIPARKMKSEGASDVEIISGFMYEECSDLLQFWKELPDKRVY